MNASPFTHESTWIDIIQVSRFPSLKNRLNVSHPAVCEALAYKVIHATLQNKVMLLSDSYTVLNAIRDRLESEPERFQSVTKEISNMDFTLLVQLVLSR